MKIFALSDVHLDTRSLNLNYHIADELEVHLQDTKPDIAIYAGDWFTKGNSETLASWNNMVRMFSDNVKQFYFIAGNHEYILRKPSEVIKYYEKMLKRLELPNVHFLYTGKVCEHDGYKIVGCPWMAHQWLSRVVDEKTIVVTHHFPSEKSQHPQFTGSPLNAWFQSPDGMEIVKNNRPRLWVHGHTHYHFHYQEQQTEFICNPFGYPFENRQGFRFDNVEI